MTFRPTRSRRLQRAWNRARSRESRRLEERLQQTRARVAADRPLLELYDRLHREAGLAVCRPVSVRAPDRDPDPDS